MVFLRISHGSQESRFHVLAGGKEQPRARARARAKAALYRSDQLAKLGTTNING